MQIGVGLIATMTALVLVTVSAKSAYDTVAGEVRNTAIDVLELDRVLARYGAETGEIRKGLKHAVGVNIDRIWPQGSSKPASLDPLHSGAASRAEELADGIRRLQPRDDFQRALHPRAPALTEALLKTRWVVLAGTASSVPGPFLAILVFWLTIIFASFGLSAPRNTLAVIVFIVCALSVASAIFLVLEMNGSFEGLLKISGIHCATHTRISISRCVRTGRVQIAATVAAGRPGAPSRP